MTQIWFRSNGDERYRFLSNFYPCSLVLGGMVGKSAEHLYQAHKFDDEGSVGEVLMQPTALAAMRYTRMNRYVSPHFDRVEVMKQVLAVKFAEGSSLAAQLLSTGDAELIEDNPGFWGGRNGGANTLGRLLMERRAALKGA